MIDAADRDGAEDVPRARVAVPPGVQCFVGDEVRARRGVERRVVAVFEGWDYEEIVPPLYDYADVFAGRALGPRTWSFLARDGSLLALRPDFTSLLAKIAAGRLAGRPAPLRLYYSGEVLRYEPPRAGRRSEHHQMGCEHLGGDPRSADAEVVTLAAECLAGLGVADFVLTLGHVGVFAALVAAAGLDESDAEALRGHVAAKDVSGVRRLLESWRLGDPVGPALLRLCEAPDGAARLRQAEDWLAGLPAARAAAAELLAVVEALDEAGLGERVRVDLGEVQDLDYYTGLVLRAYAPGLGLELGSGGRYDTLLARFGRPLPAVGFMLSLDRLVQLLDRRGLVPEPGPGPAGAVAGRLGAALAEARRRRAAGERVRFDGSRA